MHTSCYWDLRLTLCYMVHLYMKQPCLPLSYKIMKHVKQVSAWIASQIIHLYLVWSSPEGLRRFLRPNDESRWLSPWKSVTSQFTGSHRGMHGVTWERKRIVASKCFYLQKLKFFPNLDRKCLLKLTLMKMRFIKINRQSPIFSIWLAARQSPILSLWYIKSL